MLQLKASSKRGSFGQFGSEDKRYGNSLDPVKEVQARSKKPLGPLAHAILQKYFKLPNENAHVTMRSRMEGSRTVFYCGGCRCWHAKTIESFMELPLLIGDSLSVLHGSKMGRYQEDRYHTDYLCSGGSTILENLAMVVYYYWDVTIPLKAVVLSGMNNVLNGQDNESILGAYQTFKMVLDEMDESNGLVEGASTLVVATMPIPPRVYLQNKEEVDPTKPYFTNSGKKIYDLNREIQRLNNSWGIDNSSVPLLESLGRRSSVKSGTRIFSNHANWWREKDIEDRLHISNRYRDTVLSKLLRTIHLITPSRSHQTYPPISKNELLKRNGNDSAKGKDAKGKVKCTQSNDSARLSERTVVYRDEDWKDNDAGKQKRVNNTSKTPNKILKFTSEDGQEEEYEVLDEVAMENVETRTVRFLDNQEKEHNKGSTKPKKKRNSTRRPWLDVAEEARTNLTRTKRNCNRIHKEKEDEGYAWLEEYESEFDTRYGRIGSNEDSEDGRDE